MRNGAVEMMEEKIEEVCSENEKEKTTFVVVRHAEYVGLNSTRLSRKGSLQAVALAQALKEHKVTAVYSSERSLATALSIAQEFKLKVAIEYRLSQWDGGVLRGLTKAQVQARYEDIYRKRFVQRLPDYKVPQGESLNDRYQRVSSFLHDMVEVHRGEEVVVVTHGGVIDDAFRVVRSLPPEKMTGIVKPYGSISVISYDHDSETWDEEECVAVSHLPQVVAEAPTGGQLYLFPHQVAGSFPLLRGDLGELCKPATQNEIEIYRQLSEGEYEISDYIPVYLGKLNINVADILKNLAVLVKPFERMHETPCEPPSVRIKQMFDETSLSMVKNEEPKVEVDSSKLKRRRHSLTKQNLRSEIEPLKAKVDSKVPAGKDPWSVTNLWDRFSEARASKLVRTRSGEFVYLILENLTHGLNCPHILDLKMGTQQHGPDESAAKIKSKIDKCEKTTSKRVGVRLAGMQVYSEDNGQYILRDKYWGRTLNEAGLKKALKVFVTNGLEKQQQLEVVKSIISQVNGLQRAVKKTPWHFYGCSLLVVYDSKPRKPRCSSVNSSSSSDVEICSALVKKRRARSQSFGSEDMNQVAVRLIDFSHTKRDTEGFDEGLLFGLENLKRMYTKILNVLEDM